MEALVGKSVLVTGGLGCLGQNICRHLLSLGFKVYIGSSRSNAVIPSHLIGCSLVYTDFSNAKSLSRICSNIDFVIHLATINSVNSQKDPQLAIQVNGIGALNLIQASATSNVSYFLYFSTAHIYGSPTGSINEKTLPRPSHPYSITHRLAEDFLLEFIAKKKLSGAIFRLSNSIGGPVTDDKSCWTLFMNDICRQALYDRYIVVNSNPLIERDFVTMPFIFNAIVHFLNKNPVSDFPVYNVGGGRSYTLADAARLVAQQCNTLYGFSPMIKFTQEPQSLQATLQYNIEKLTSELSFKPEIDLTIGIDSTLRFFQTRLA